MRRILSVALLSFVVIVTGGATDCNTSTCTASGFSPGSQVQISHRNTSGQTVDLVGYADGNGEIHVENCQEILAQFGD